MKTHVITAAVSCALLACAIPASADNRLVRFDGGIGVIPTGSGATTVRTVQPAGQIWVIRDLKADVRSDGSIRVDGRGLLLGSGDNVGFNNNASVFATLICGVDQHSTTLTGVALEPDGDFRIDDVLTPPPPAECLTPVLLIRNVAGTRNWFAAGIPKQ
jgi:hypothetical protein